MHAFPFEADRILANLERLRELRLKSGEQPYRGLIGEEVRLIDPATLTAKQAYRQLFLKQLLVQSAGQDAPKVERLYVSVPSPGLDSSKLTSEGETCC